MTKLRDTPAQLSLFDQSSFGALDSGILVSRKSNVVSFDFAKRIQPSIAQEECVLEEKLILEEVLSEAKKLKW